MGYGALVTLFFVVLIVRQSDSAGGEEPSGGVIRGRILPARNRARNSQIVAAVAGAR